MVTYRNKDTGDAVRMSAPLRPYEQSDRWERVQEPARKTRRGSGDRGVSEPQP